ncbi:FMN-binding protein [Maribacter sp. CXY002]|uniref:FMN-binding protein n=1 Tax=Maribacter luteocoastalis TaxID=3407671 RepID=UPI003B67023E
MMRPLRFVVAFAVLGLLLSSFGLSKSIHKKVVREIQNVLDIETFELEAVAVSNQDVSAKLPIRITGDNFFKINTSNDILGYVFVDQASSKTAKFDFMVVFDPQLKIIHSKVLIYREEYGGEIGSKRWLKQFLGKTIGDRVDYETNIDGIAGATISVRSMTNAIDNLLQSLTILKNKNQL